MDGRGGAPREHRGGSRCVWWGATVGSEPVVRGDATTTTVRGAPGIVTASINSNSVQVHYKKPAPHVLALAVTGLSASLRCEPRSPDERRPMFRIIWASCIAVDQRRARTRQAGTCQRMIYGLSSTCTTRTSPVMLTTCSEGP